MAFSQTSNFVRSSNHKLYIVVLCCCCKSSMHVHLYCWVSPWVKNKLINFRMRMRGGGKKQRNSAPFASASFTSSLNLGAWQQQASRVGAGNDDPLTVLALDFDRRTWRLWSSPQKKSDKRAELRNNILATTHMKTLYIYILYDTAMHCKFGKGKI